MGARADYVSRFHKGQRVFVVGRLDISEWTTREGEPRTSYDIWADDVVNLSPRDDGAGAAEPAGNGYAPPVGAQRSNSRRSARQQDEAVEEDLPF